jgi:rubrerythrin
MVDKLVVEAEDVSKRESDLLERYVVIIEWNDGNGNEGKSVQPPTKWYRMLHKFGIRVRTEAEAGNVVESRLDAKQSTVIVQEGAVITFSYSLARLIAARLMRGIEVEHYEFGEVDGKRKVIAVTKETVRPALVLFGKLDIEKNFEPSIADVRALEHVERVHGKRGRKAPPSNWAVTCYECMATHNVEEGTPTSCPICNGVQIDYHPGNVMTLKDDPEVPVLYFWLRSRFATGHFQFPTIDEENGLPASADYKIAADWQQDTAMTFLDAPLLDQMAALKLSRETQLAFLDAAYTTRSVWSDKRRMNARLEAVTQFLMVNTDPSALTEISMTEMPQPDLFDLAGMVGKEQAAALMVAYLARRVSGADEDAAVVDVPAVRTPGKAISVRKLIA